MFFPTKASGNDPQVNYVKKESLTAKISELSWNEGLTPKQAIRTKEFFLLSLKIMLTELVFFYLLFVYKVSFPHHFQLSLLIPESICSHIY